MTRADPPATPRPSQRLVWGWAALVLGLALAVKGGWLVAFDRGVTQWLDTLRTPSLDATARALTFFGGSPWILGLAAVMGGWWWRLGRHRTMAACFLAGACGLLLQIALRFLVSQWRPEAVVPEPMSLIARYELAGFTSGHAFRSAFLYGWWADLLWRRKSAWAAAGAVGCWLLIVLMGLTRVYLHRHWCTDVVGAWLIAMTALAATARDRRQTPVRS